MIHANDKPLPEPMLTMQKSDRQHVKITACGKLTTTQNLQGIDATSDSMSIKVLEAHSCNTVVVLTLFKET